MAVANGFGKTVTSGSVFMYDTSDIINSYRGEPTTNLLPSGVAEGHNSGAYGNVVTVTDATTEKGPGWKKVTISNRGSNFRIIQWTYLEMSANITYCFSAEFDWGNMRDKGYFIYFDGSGTGGRTYYRPGNYVNGASSDINSSMTDGKFAGTILHTATHTHTFFIGNYSYNVSGLNDYFYYKEFQAETKSHPTQFTTGTRSATQGLLPIVGNSSINLSNVSFDSNAQMVFDGTDDFINVNPNLGIVSQYTIEHVSYKGSENRMPISSVTTPIFYQYGDNSWYYTHGGVAAEYYYPKSFTINGWGHWTIVYDGSYVKIYRNGVFEGQQATTGTANWTNGIRIGNYIYGGYPWDGKIPIVKMYNRALSAAEIRQNYNKYKTRFNLP